MKRGFFCITIELRVFYIHITNTIRSILDAAYITSNTTTYTNVDEPAVMLDAYGKTAEMCEERFPFQ